MKKNKVKAFRVSYGNQRVTISDLFPFAAGRKRVSIPYNYDYNSAVELAVAWLEETGAEVLGYAEASDHYLVFCPLDTIL